MYHSFEQLDVWKRATAVAVDIVRVLQDCRVYSLKDQMIRSSISIPSNIAEGIERSSHKETLHFLHIAKGSSAELRTQLIIAEKAGFIEQEFSEKTNTELIEISKMLHGLAKSIHNQNT